MEKHLLGKPFALSMGPQRCGNVWIDKYLSSRDDVCLPEDVKEIFYFDRHFLRGPEFYISHFNPEDHHNLVMEISTTAFDNPQAPERVYDLFGHDIALICPLRHPVQRSILVYQDYLNYGIVKGSIEEAVEQAPQILHASRYGDHLENWCKQFGQNCIKFIFVEKIEQRPESFVNNLCNALSIPYIVPAADLLQNNPKSRNWRQFIFRNFKNKPSIYPLSHNDITWLKDRLDPEIKRIEHIVGHLIPQWNK